MEVYCLIILQAGSLKPRYRFGSFWRLRGRYCPMTFLVSGGVYSSWSSLTWLCITLISASVFPRIRVFSNEPALRIRWPKYWSFSFSLSNKYSGLISFRMGWLDLAVQGTLKSLLQHHSSKGSILRDINFPDAGKDWIQEENKMAEDEMAGWHHSLDGHEFE